MYNYIPHPSNCAKSSMITVLLIEEGHAAYGIYWMILELMRDNQNYRISNNAKAIAWAIHCQDLNLVDRVIHNYGLFDQDDNGLLFSPWLIDQMNAYDTKKRKLQEAGRRGAAKRFASKNNGEAIATPSVDDGEAIANIYNVTQRDMTYHHTTTSSDVDEEDWKAICNSQGLKVDDEYVAAIARTQPEGHAPGYVAQVCRQYGIGQNVLDYLLRRTDNAAINNSRYTSFVNLIKRIEKERYMPKHPANFICSKIN